MESIPQAIPPEYTESSGGLRIGAGGDTKGSSDGSTGLVAIVDEIFVYGTALAVDELDFLYRAAQVCFRFSTRV